MAFPPNDVEASALFLRLSARVTPSEVWDFPGSKDKIRMCVLRMEKHTEAKLTANERLKEQLKNYGKVSTMGQTVDPGLISDVLGDLVACELIALACHDATSFTDSSGVPQYRRMFVSGSDVERLLTADEITKLFSYYKATQLKYGPLEDSCSSDEEVNAWITRLGEGGDAFPLHVLESHQLVDLCKHLVSRALVLSSLIRSQQESSPINWELIPTIWGFGTGSSGEPVVESSPLLSSEPIGLERAAEIARLMRGGV